MIVSQIFLWVALGLCMIMTGATAITFKVKWAYRSDPSFYYLLYYAVLIYVYGFYSLWSSEIIEALQISADIPLLSRILNLLGAPFIIMALGTLAFFLRQFFAYKTKPWILLIGYLSIYLIGIVALTLDIPLLKTFQEIILIAGFIVYLIASVLFLLKKTTYLRHGMQILMALTQIALAYYYFHNLVQTGTPFQLGLGHLYFFGVQSGFIIALLTNGKFMTFEPNGLNVDDLASRYRLTKREVEIVRELILGKSNSEIAESLFITEQTVKDHMSRIYQKTYVKSRTQLLSLIKS